MNVLVIDNQIYFANGIRWLLEKHNPLIKTSYSGDISAAYEFIQSTQLPDLMLLNINENCQENSYELVHRLNKLDLYIPLIVVSKNDSSEAVALAIENNALGFISKDSSHEVILETVMFVLKKRKFVSEPIALALNEAKKADPDKALLR